ncbi:unnamed protein product [Protopolystoma xenopodis]|uniref:Uncharacterized protein n=1 Tax=Protopolystoma xenopodis TaxID=117903 RepID=A0A3S5CNJ2_9PLAT|nr:unnamed protein product [Protopolystoma xenopodis]
MRFSAADSRRYRQLSKGQKNSSDSRRLLSQKPEYVVTTALRRPDQPEKSVWRLLLLVSSVFVMLEDDIVTRPEHHLESEGLIQVRSTGSSAHHEGTRTAGRQLRPEQDLLQFRFTASFAIASSGVCEVAMSLYVPCQTSQIIPSMLYLFVRVVAVSLMCRNEAANNACLPEGTSR